MLLPRFCQDDWVRDSPASTQSATQDHAKVGKETISLPTSTLSGISTRTRAGEDQLDALFALRQLLPGMSLCLGDQLLDGIFVFVVGIELQKFFPCGHCPGRVTFTLPPNQTEVQKSSGMFGIVGKRFFELSDGTVHVALIVQARSHIGSRPDVPRIHIQSLLIVRRGCLELMSHAIQRADLVQQIRIVGIDRKSTRLNSS